MFIGYLKIKIGEKADIIVGLLLLISIFLFSEKFLPLLEEGLILKFIVSILIYGSVCYIIIKIVSSCYINKYKVAQKIYSKLKSRKKNLFQNKKFTKITTLVVLSKIRLPFGLTAEMAELFLVRFLPYLFQEDQQEEKIENAFLNLLALLEFNKILLLDSLNALYNQSTTVIRHAVNFITIGEIHDVILDQIKCILVLIQAIVFLTNGKFQSIKEIRLNKFIDDWIRFSGSIGPVSADKIPKSLYNKEFVMEGYSIENFYQLFKEFNRCRRNLHDKENFLIVATKLMEKRARLRRESKNTVSVDANNIIILDN